APRKRRPGVAPHSRQIGIRRRPTSLLGGRGMRFRSLTTLLMVATLLANIRPATAAMAWQTNGNPVCTAPNTQEGPAICSDGAGGAIIAWWDFRYGDYDIYAQRVGADGTMKWDADGVEICTEALTQDAPKIVPDGAGGAIITWEDFRNGVTNNLFAQR